MNQREEASFSASRRWGVRLNVTLGVVSAVALALMMNYLAARYFFRSPIARAAQSTLSPLTQRVLGLVTNQVKVTVLFDRDDDLFEPVQALLREYKYANNKIVVETVDYIRQPAEAQIIKAVNKLSQGPDKDIVIFNANGRTRVVSAGELSEIDVQPLISGQSKEARRTHFKGELMFTSALMTVTSGKPLKAYFLQGHGEHRPDDDNRVMGYSRFAALLGENNIKTEALSLMGSAEVPADCHLLIIAGPKDPFLAEELERIDRYLRQGGRVLALLNHDSVTRQVGLEKLLAGWGVIPSQDVVIDAKYSSPGQVGKDMVVHNFGNHPIMTALYQSKLTLYMMLPRSIRKGPTSTDSPEVTVLAMSSSEARTATDIREGAVHPRADDFAGAVPLIVAVEKGNIKGVLADRGATRMVVAGDSYFLGNQTLDLVGNREFATHALNWLLARNELLVGLAPRPITEYKLTMTTSQLKTTRWALMAGMPGTVLLAGLLVAARRRR